MSTLKTNRTQLGQSGTSTQNFTITAEAADGTMKLARGNAGATTQDILTVDASGLVTLSQGRQLTLGTAQNTTSGTSIDFTGIPSWVKRITVMFNGVSTNGASPVTIRLGTSGGVDSAGYSGVLSVFGSASTSSSQLSTGFKIDFGSASTSSEVRHGHATIVFIADTSWSCNAALGHNNTTWIGMAVGSKTLSGTLDRIRITTENGTDTFDAGSVNILYEG